MADRAEVSNEAVAEAVDDIADTPEDVSGQVSEADVDLVGAICQICIPG